MSSPTNLKSFNNELKDSKECKKKKKNHMKNEEGLPCFQHTHI
jgi:hypothetical protein